MTSHSDAKEMTVSQLRFPMTPPVRRLVGLLVGRSAIISLKGGKLHLHASFGILV